MIYLVRASKGPGSASTAESRLLLENLVLPTFAVLRRLEEDGKILAGGLPVGDRALVFILRTRSHDEADRILRNLPLWSNLNWEVVPLQSFSDREFLEREALKQLGG